MNIPDPAYLEQHKPGYGAECCPTFAATKAGLLHLHVFKLVRTERFMRLERCRCGVERWEFIEP